MDSLTSLFGATYLINLPERVDRLKSAKKQLLRGGCEIGPGGVQIFPAFKYMEPARFPSAAIRGCFQSHLECLRRAEAEGRASVLLIEDDIGLSTSMPRLLPSIKSKLLDLEWDFIYFGHHGTGDIAEADRNTSESEIKFDLWTDELLTTHFYGLRGRILSRLIAHLERLSAGTAGDQNAGPMPIDGAYNIFRRENPEVKCLIVRPRFRMADLLP